MNFPAPTLSDQLNPKNEFYLLANAIDWDYYDREFAPLYSERGRPGHLVRELERKLPNGACAGELELDKKVLAQEKNSKNKIYSLYEPEVYCMCKGKAHKKCLSKTKKEKIFQKKSGDRTGYWTSQIGSQGGKELPQGANGGQYYLYDGSSRVQLQKTDGKTKEY